MARPGDYGDPRPSDIGDVAPPNPVAGFGQTNFNLGGLGGAVRGGNAPGMRDVPGKANPDLEIPKPGEESRIVFTGVLVRPAPGRNAWYVLRQDGKLGVAYARSDDGIYEGLTRGEHVVMVQGQLGKNQWLITGSHRNFELSSLSLTNSESHGPSDNQIRINFDEVINRSGDDANLVQFREGVRVTQHKYGLYQIDWQVTVICVNPDEAESKIRIEKECLPTDTIAPVGVTADTLVVDRRVGFELYRRPDILDDGPNLKGIVSLQIPPPFMMAQSAANINLDPNVWTDDPVTWTDAPILGHSLTVGLRVPQGWIKIYDNANNYLWLGNGYTRQRIRFPDDLPYVGSHLVVAGQSGECVQLKWSPTGGTGTITAYDCYCNPLVWFVEDGLIVSGPGIGIPINQQVDCSNYPFKVWDCENPLE